MKKFIYSFCLIIAVLSVLVFLGWAVNTAVVRPVANDPLPSSIGDVTYSAIYLLFAAIASLFWGVILRVVEYNL